MMNLTVSAQSANPAMAYLEVQGDDVARPAVYSLHDEVVIGRESDEASDAAGFLRIPEHTVSRRHTRIRRRGDTYFIEDLHSFNGTFVNGERLLPGHWHALQDGDELIVSSSTIVFHSLMISERESPQARITKAVDATQWSAVSEASPQAAGEDMHRTVKKLHAMAQVGIALGVVRDRATLTEKIMAFIFDLFPQAERAFILLRSGEDEAPVPVAARRRDGTVEDPRQACLSRTIVDQVVNRKQAVLSVDTLSDRHFGYQESIVAQAIRSVMCVPLLLENECLGLIQVDTSSDPYAFREPDLELLTGVCAEAAVALKNFQLYSDIERLLDGFVRASVQAIEERDPVTAGHSFRVAKYAVSLATAVDRDDSPTLRQVQFSTDQVRELRYAALLHDFGKVGVREHVLRKEKKLHHMEMHLLEQRFRHARACLERQAYRELVELHCRHELDIARFRAEKEKVEAGLQLEFARLERFLGAIRLANEPTVSHADCGAELQEVLHYAYPDTDARDGNLLGENEFLALSVSKGCLTQDERRQIEAHVADSYSFLVLIPWTGDLAGVPSIAHGHHEKLDGSGYPLGLHAGQISVPTRILTICDIYDALTASDRPYKRAIPLESALDLMQHECRQGKIDPVLFNVFVESRAWEGRPDRDGSETIH
jgi:HD-GYP domain-containing protein (c-di-GMP phosphodiesterase class II)